MSNLVYKEEIKEGNNITGDFRPIGPTTIEPPDAQTRILVVDDQVFNIEFLRCQLELIPSLAGRCDYVDNGPSAIRLVNETLVGLRKDGSSASSSYYSLILLDYSMPKMDGPMTARKIGELY